MENIVCPNCGAEVAVGKTLREWIELWTRPKDVSTPEPEAVKPKPTRKAVVEAVMESEESDGS